MTRTLPLPNRQRGMATILVVILAGLAITATTLSVMHQVRSTQDQQMAVHASTQTESLAWTGVELTRLYLEQQTSLSTVATGPLSISGISGLSVNITAISGNRVTATIIGSSSLASTTLQAVYDVTIKNGNTAGGANLKSSLVWNGNVSYSGGSLQVVDGSNLANVAINGDISISSGAQATISGCATGNITLSGGGISSTSLSAEGDILISSMREPNGLSLWAKNIYIRQFNGNYNNIKAGAFTADIISNGATIGTAITGGSNINSSGNIIPLSSGTAVLTLSNNTTYLLNFKDTTSNNGVIVTTGATTLISGTTELPSTISLKYKGIHGGTIEIESSIVGNLWGNTATLSGWDGNYTSFKTHQSANVINPIIGSLISGGSLYATKGSYDAKKNTYGSFPSISGGTIAGHIYYGASKTIVADTATVNGVNLSRGVTATDPGLPGVPYCNVQANPVDVDNFRDVANYAFYFEGNIPMLKINNVKNSSGTSIDGTYNLLTGDVRSLAGFDLMQCGWSNNHCLRSSTPSSGWTLTGINRFPPGVLWFDGNVRIDGVNTTTQPRLYNGILTTGNINLTSAGHGPLYAPNFASAANICNGNFYPTNLCDKSGNSAAFVKWTDATGTIRTGLPLGNIAIASEGNLTSSGWEVHGHVLLGGSADTAGATTTIYGALSVGGNQRSSTTISAGGILVNTANMAKDQTFVPDDSDSNSSPATTTAKVRWVRTL